MSLDVKHSLYFIRAQEKQKLAESAAEAAAAALRKPDVISGATARSAPADAAPAVCQVCGASFLSKTKVSCTLGWCCWMIVAPVMNDDDDDDDNDGDDNFVRSCSRT